MNEETPMLSISNWEEELEVEDNRSLAENAEGNEYHTNLLPQAPELPASKKYHLFVCYATEDRHRVFPVVTHLENQLGAKCLFADRDFQPGKDIRVNIEEGINDSVKILTVLTPNFSQSRYCLHESEIAFQKSMETGLNYVIPVLLEECEIPYGLKPKTYIDGTLPDMDAMAIAQRITIALNQPASSNTLLAYEMISEENRCKNGFSFDIEARPHRCCRFKSPGYKFHLDDAVHRLHAARITVTSRQISQAISLLNQHSVLRWHNLQNRRKLCVMGMCICPIIPLLVVAFVYIFGLILATPDQETSKLKFSGYNGYNVCIFSIIVAPIIVCICLCICGKWKFTQIQQNAENQLWQEVTSKTYKECVAFTFTHSADRTPTLRVIRYDVKKCQAYIAGCLRRERNCDDERDMDCQLQATMITEHWLRKICSNPITIFPDASSNRHNVIQDKMCICQLYESHPYGCRF